MSEMVCDLSAEVCQINAISSGVISSNEGIGRNLVFGAKDTDRRLVTAACVSSVLLSSDFSELNNGMDNRRRVQSTCRSVRTRMLARARSLGDV